MVLIWHILKVQMKQAKYAHNSFNLNLFRTGPRLKNSLGWLNEMTIYKKYFKSLGSVS